MFIIDKVSHRYGCLDLSFRLIYGTQISFEESQLRFIIAIWIGEDWFMGERLKGKVAIVTGAGAIPGAPDRPPVGNGRAAAMVFAREGAAILAVDTHAESAGETKRMIEKEGGTCSVFLGDISRAADCKAMAENCHKGLRAN